MKFTSDRQRKAAFASMNRFSDNGRKVVVIAGNFQKGGVDDFVKELYNDPVLDVKKVAAIDNNTKGLSEIYLETNNDMARKIAFTISATPGPVRGSVISDSFDDIVDNSRFIMMGGHLIDKLSDVEIPSDVYSKKSLTAVELAGMTYSNLLKNPNMTYEEANNASFGYLKELENSGDDKLKKWAEGEIDKREMEKGRLVYSKSPIQESIERQKKEIQDKLLDLRTQQDALGRYKKVRYIDELLNSGTLSEPQREVLISNRKKFETNEEFSKHPKAIGSVWVGGDYVHGPRIRDPDEFEFVKNVKPSAKFFHITGSGKLPKSLPEGSKIVVGKLKKSDDWAVQSTLIPKESKFGKSLIN